MLLPTLEILKTQDRRRSQEVKDGRTLPPFRTPKKGAETKTPKHQPEHMLRCPSVEVDFDPNENMNRRFDPILPKCSLLME